MNSNRFQQEIGVDVLPEVLLSGEVFSPLQAIQLAMHLHTCQACRREFLQIHGKERIRREVLGEDDPGAMMLSLIREMLTLLDVMAVAEALGPQPDPAEAVRSTVN